MTKGTTLLIASLLSVTPLLLFGQTSRLQGRILDAKTQSPLAGVHVKVVDKSDTADVFHATTDAEGRFMLAGVGLHSYLLEATLVGHVRISRTVRVEYKTVQLSDLLMTEGIIPLGEVVVEGSPPPAVQKADTTEFNAGAFKTNPDAVAEDLVTKLPGVTVENGTVKAHGEDVQQVLVDGKPFFGNDPTLALRNLPADAVEKIQIFDKLSDQAEFTGFDDGQSLKTMNIVMRPERRNQQFGKTYGGYGNDDRYTAGGSANYFQSGARFSVIGLTNNVNQQNFSTQDLLGVIGNTNQRSGPGGGGGGGFQGRRGGGGGGGGFGGGPGGGFGGGPGGPGGNIGNFLVGQQSGITTTNSIGGNYSDTWWNDLGVTQSYFFNLTKADNSQLLRREYFGNNDSSTFYNENSQSNSRNTNHRYEMRAVYNADSSNSIIFQPRLYFQSNTSSSTLGGVNTYETQQVINQTDNSSNSDTHGNNLSEHIVLRHRFDLPGRTISVDVGTGYNWKRGTSAQQAKSEYYQGSAVSGDTLNQQTPIVTDGYSISSRIAYTEPITDISQLQLTYNPSYSKSNADNRKYSFDPVSRQYIVPYLSLSNSYENDYTTQNGGVGYRLRLSGTNVMAGVSYQIASLKGRQQFPFSSTVGRTFYNVLPNAMLMVNGQDHTNLRVFYRTSTQAPSISQLQNVINNSNALILSTGNPNLNQSYSHSVAARYSVTDVEHARSLFLLLSAGYTTDYVGNTTITASRDTTLAGGILMNRGTQLTYPVNLDNKWNINSFVTYSFVVGFLKSNLNLSTGISFNRTPGLINQTINRANTVGLSGGAVLSSNISPDVDYTLSYSGNYNVAKNSYDASLDNRYYYHTAGMKLNLIFWDGFVFRNETSNSLYNGLSNGFNQDFILWNIHLARKLFHNQQGEIQATVVDVLNQNKSVNRSVTETYIEDTQNNVLGRYFMITFTYTVR